MSNKSGIPSWQRAQAPSSPAPLPEQQPQPEEQTESTIAPPVEDVVKEAAQSETPSLLLQATKFLEDPAIRDAPREKKVAFLQDKGVAAEDIEKLLSVSPKEDVPAEPPKEVERSASIPSQTSQSTPSTTPPKRQDIPPIITYPEFLVEPIKPPPLITTQRLLNTAYVTGGLMATMYGLSKFIIAPMVHNLAEARHDYASHTKEKLHELNKKLLEVASEDPAEKVKPVISEIEVDDVSEADSDPTELFHRDVGTQTTPMLSRRASLGANDEDSSTVGKHEKQLKILTSHLKELEENRAASTSTQDSLRTGLSDLQTYLQELSYSNTYYSGMGGLYGGNYGLPKTKDGKDDPVEGFKQDIRGVKGLFLSARNFPPGGAGAFGA